MHSRLRRYVRFGVVGFAVALCAAVSLARAAEPLPKGTISGTLVDTSGGPVAGASVSLTVRLPNPDDMLGTDQTLVEATTDANGRFQLGPLEAVYRPKPKLALRAEVDGFAPFGLFDETLSIYPGADNDLGRLHLEPPCFVLGEVLDADGKPCKGATVEFDVWLKHAGQFIVPQCSVATDAGGHFRSRPLAVGIARMRVHADGHRSVSRQFPVGPAGSQPLEEPIRLERDVPIPGAVVDDQGRPLAGAEVWGVVNRPTVADGEGRFVVRGFGPDDSFTLAVGKGGYLARLLRVTVTDKGFRCRDGKKDLGTMEELVVSLSPSAYVEGRAVDADTLEPVKIDRVTLCTFKRQPDGSILVGTCLASKFEQPRPGYFRVPYFAPKEYHLAVSAAGYHDGETFTPPIETMQTVNGVLVKLKKKTGDSVPQIQTQRVSGTVTRDGKPVKTGWVALWLMFRPNALPFALRGRVAVPPPAVFASAPIRDGRYTVDAPFQREGWYLVAEEPGHAVTQVGPFDLAADQRKQIDVECVEGGGILGLVKRLPAELQGRLWAVAFSKTAIRAEAHVAADGTFAFENLPPGEYGLKVGQNAFEDSDAPVIRSRKDVATKVADPWRRAVMVTVKSGRDVEGVELEYPKK